MGDSPRAHLAYGFNLGGKENGWKLADVDTVWRAAAKHFARPAEFDRNSAAIAWARAKIQRQVDKMAEWERQATEDGKTDPAPWRKIRNFMQREFLGTGNCVIAAFDERLPEYKAMLDRAVKP